MQGIKFYDPEVVGGTPKQVEYEGIMRLLEGIKEQVGLEKGKTILDPSDKVCQQPSQACQPSTAQQLIDSPHPSELQQGELV